MGCEGEEWKGWEGWREGVEGWRDEEREGGDRGMEGRREGRMEEGGDRGMEGRREGRMERGKEYIEIPEASCWLQERMEREMRARGDGRRLTSFESKSVWGKGSGNVLICVNRLM